MGDVKQPLGLEDRERLLAELAEREAGQSGGALSEGEEATLAALRAELDTLVSELREPSPADEFAEESDCRRAVELVESIGRPAEGSSSGALGAAADAAGRVEFERLGPYEVIEKLGEGGMGAVYKAVHPKLKRTVAIKVLPARRMKSAAALARFEREMAAVGALNHPNIVTAHDAGEDAGMHYLVMEYVDGLDLATLVRRVGPLEPADACEIVRQAARGLAEAAARGIVHRDVKPSNLMLSRAATEGAVSLVKILDFGLARLSPLHGDGDELTTSGLIMGTLKYMAPEQCSQSHEVDARADVYSLGATLYKLLCGSSPYSDERFNSPLALLAALGGEAPPALATRRADVPPRLAAIVHRMMAKNPAERYATPGAVVEALEPWSQGANLSALLERGQQSADPVDGAKSSAPRGAVMADALSETSRRRNRLMLRWLLAAGLGLAAVALALLWRPLVGGPSPTVRSRSAAEWLALHNARFGVSKLDGEYVEINAGEALPPGAIELNTVDLGGDKLLRDEDLARFQELPQLELLNFSYTNIGDAGMARLRNLPQLNSLFLVETRITDATLVELRRFPKLRTLFIARTAATDAGLEGLAGLPELDELALSGCRITDEGLPWLAALTTLRTLHITETDVTARGVGTLQLALPGCSVLSDFTDDEIRHASIEELDSEE